jgi:ribosomal protein S18 acetylase RimI-like enzyme
MWAFLHEDHARRGEQYTWHPSRLGGWLTGLWSQQKFFPIFFEKNCELWFDAAGNLTGFALTENGDEVLYIFTREDDDHLYAEILDWSVDYWGRSFGKVIFEVHEFQAEALGALERKGFRSKGEVAMTRVYDLAARAREPIRLAEGFRIVDMNVNDDYHSRALLLLDAFQERDDIKELDLLQFEFSRQNPARDPALDLSVLDAAGKHVASCQGYMDGTLAAEIEVVCTHSKFRRLGLGEAVVRECFRRLAQRGVEKACITGYSNEANGLYEKLGPSAYKRWFHYELDTKVRST